MPMLRGSASFASSARFRSSPAISASEATATAIISRPSSVVPMENTLTRGVALARRRMYSYTSFEYGSLFGAPAMSPSTAAGVGTPFAAGRESTSGERKKGSVVYSWIFFVYASSSGWDGLRPGRKPDAGAGIGAAAPGPPAPPADLVD